MKKPALSARLIESDMGSYKFQDGLRDVLNEISMVFEKIDPEQAENVIGLIEEADKVFVIGRGRSGYMMQGLCMRLVHLGYKAYYVGDVSTPPISGRDLLIIGSGSGATASVVCLGEKAKSLGARVALLTLSKQSPLSSIADAVLIVPGSSPGNKDSAVPTIQPLASLFEECLELCCEVLVTTIFTRRGLTNNEISKNHTNIE